MGVLLPGTENGKSGTEKGGTKKTKGKPGTRRNAPSPGGEPAAFPALPVHKTPFRRVRGKQRRMPAYVTGFVVTATALAGEAGIHRRSRQSAP